MMMMWITDMFCYQSAGLSFTKPNCFTAGGRFEVDERSGVVRTRGSDPFQLDMEYVLYVKAEDQNGRLDDRRYQSTPEERLSIVGGKRPPQFYMPKYEAEIPENRKKDSE